MTDLYFTGIPYHKAKARMGATLPEGIVLGEDCKGVFGDDVEVFTLERKGGFFLWCVQNRAPHPNVEVVSPGLSAAGTLMIESHGGNSVDEVMPWIEQALSCTVLDQYGHPWYE